MIKDDELKKLQHKLQVTEKALEIAIESINCHCDCFCCGIDRDFCKYIKEGNSNPGRTLKVFFGLADYDEEEIQKKCKNNLKKHILKRAEKELLEGKNDTKRNSR